MTAPVLHTLQGEKLWLSAQRAIYWEGHQSLILSDLHFGKTGHFRKAGIPVPQGVYKEDLQRLVSLLQQFQPKELLVVGDFFHSSANTELDWFLRWRENFPFLQIVLIQGNHDILHADWYRQAAIEVVSPTLQRNGFLFSHDQCEASPELYSFCGHLHPGVVLHGLGKQSLRFPCFYFGSRTCILPAFSKFTGAVAMDKTAAQAVYAIVDNELIALR